MRCAGLALGQLWSGRSVDNSGCLSEEIIRLIALSVKGVLGVGDGLVGGAGTVAQWR